MWWEAPAHLTSMNLQRCLLPLSWVGGETGDIPTRGAHHIRQEQKFPSRCACEAAFDFVLAWDEEQCIYMATNPF